MPSRYARQCHVMPTQEHCIHQCFQGPHCRLCRRQRQALLPLRGDSRSQRWYDCPLTRPTFDHLLIRILPTEPVTVVVGKNFDSVVLDESKVRAACFAFSASRLTFVSSVNQDVFLEIYAPCKQFSCVVRLYQLFIAVLHVCRVRPLQEADPDLGPAGCQL